jgi:hypothetical protein
MSKRRIVRTEMPMLGDFKEAAEQAAGGRKTIAGGEERRLAGKVGKPNVPSRSSLSWHPHAAEK